MEREFVPHDVQWTPTRVRRFWDWLSSLESYQTNNFANLAGESIIRFLRQNRVPLSGSILDFGCGTGSLLEKLLMNGVSCEGAETSQVAADRALRKLSHYTGFGGITVVDTIPTSFAENRFDLVVALETIEHLAPEDTEPTIRELYRIAKPGGFIMISTPNSENLEAGRIMCPDCGCIFHRGQHTTSWDIKSLNNLMTKSGFSTITCRAVTIRTKRNILRDLAAAILRQKKLNLLYLGAKKGSPSG